MNKFNFSEDTIRQTALKILEQEGLGALTKENISAKLNNYTDISRLYPLDDYIIVDILTFIQEKAFQNIPHFTTEPKQERLFEVIMGHLDEALLYKKALERLAEEVIWSPSTLLFLYPYVNQMIDKVLAYCDIHFSSALDPKLWIIRGSLYRIGCFWLKDTTLDQSLTMKELDQTLKHLQDNFSGINFMT